MQSVSSADERSGGECVEPNDPESDNKPILFSQETLNNLCRDLYLTKYKNVFLASRLQERNLHNFMQERCNIEWIDVIPSDINTEQFKY
ncbi:Hypothetical predicted protein [Octopus vulgaris]|uniref:Uncharacterized protein n=1 Tax=Octopus vulgaris TaxID=6645 RepID=A0AA36FFM2_OCTVU|nr:Hypothetical predicted protein [Octopus vulgaris]